MNVCIYMYVYLCMNQIFLYMYVCRRHGVLRVCRGGGGEQEHAAQSQRDHQPHDHAG